MEAPGNDFTEEVIAKHACRMADDAGCRLIVAISQSGLTASVLAKHRPRAKILLCTDNRATQHRFVQHRGVLPLLLRNLGRLPEQLLPISHPANQDSIDYVRSTINDLVDEYARAGIAFARANKILGEGDKVLLIRTMPEGYDQLLKIVVA